jgi:uncharacterized protein YndB with AHSA1/START domain
MKSKNLVASAQVTIDAPVDKVWNALVDPAMIKKYMFGTTVISDWKEGSTIVWTGEWQGKHYEDKGTIMEIKPKRKLKYTHFSPLTGHDDVPENYHEVTILLTAGKERTSILLTQDNNVTEDERTYSEKNWNTMLTGLKKLLEEDNREGS